MSEDNRWPETPGLEKAIRRLADADPVFSDCDICGNHPGARVIWVSGTETVACAHCLERGAP